MENNLNITYDRLAYEWVGSCPCEYCKLNCHADDDFDLEKCREDCDEYIEWINQYSNKYKEFLNR